MPFYIATLNLLNFRNEAESFWNDFFIKDVTFDKNNLIEILDKDDYKLFITIDIDAKITKLSYQANTEISHELFKNDARDEIIKALNRIEIAFISGIEFLKIYSPYRKTKYENFLEVKTLNADGLLEASPAMVYGYTEGVLKASTVASTASLDEITRILKIDSNDIDEYIDRLLSIKKLISDPVLHLTSLFSLYEFIKESKVDIVGYLKATNKLGSNTNLEEVFRNTRNFVAHGYAGGKDHPQTAKILQEFLGKSNKSKTYKFDRYNESHINLINDVINESQVIIVQYLKNLIRIPK